jgi:hypothetical protein
VFLCQLLRSLHQRHRVHIPLPLAFRTIQRHFMRYEKFNGVRTETVAIPLPQKWFGVVEDSHQQVYTAIGVRIVLAELVSETGMHIIIILCFS